MRQCVGVRVTMAAAFRSSHWLAVRTRGTLLTCLVLCRPAPGSQTAMASYSYAAPSALVALEHPGFKGCDSTHYQLGPSSELNGGPQLFTP